MNREPDANLTIMSLSGVNITRQSFYSQAIFNNIDRTIDNENASIIN